MKILNNLIANILPYFPKNVVGYFSKDYIAGATAEDAVNAVKNLMAEGCCATIDILGEEITRKEQSTAAVNKYHEMLETIQTEKLDANISLKPTHMGLKIDRNFCFQNIRSLVEHARQLHNFVRIDMEDSTCTDDTLEFYRTLHEEFDNVGVVLQAYLRRTIPDINVLSPLKPNIRLCKGIYVEPHRLAYKDRELINKNYAYALQKLFENNAYVGIATHDELLIWEALRLIDQLKLGMDQYEFQMLLGVQPHLRRLLVESGHRLRVYVPFGQEWFAYSTRRLKENPHIVGSILRNTFSRFSEND